jgi:hypothetical protein
MRRDRRTPIAWIALAALTVAGCTQTGTGGGGATATGSVPATSTTATTGATPAGGQVFTARLQPVNASGVSGVATVTAVGASLTVEISATGMVAGQMHAQHIHSKNSGPSTCPPEPATSGTVIPESQAEQYYGPVLVPLEPFPTADSAGTVSYSAEVSGIPANAIPLEGRAIVLHGLMVNGAYDPSVPVACGELVAATGTPLPGGGGASGESSGTTSSGASTYTPPAGGGGGTYTPPAGGQGGAQTAPGMGATTAPSP